MREEFIFSSLYSMIKRFTQINNQDILTVGGKGASLGEMTQAGFPVPNGFVLTTKAF
jgi:pyruvate,water dikinase